MYSYLRGSSQIKKLESDSVGGHCCVEVESATSECTLSEFEPSENRDDIMDDIDNRCEVFVQRQIHGLAPRENFARERIRSQVWEFRYYSTVRYISFFAKNFWK